MNALRAVGARPAVRTAEGATLGWFRPEGTGPGAPPGLSTAMDTGVAVVADARVDARADLVQRLRGATRGVEFDNPDAALIGHAYAAWGLDCVAAILGDFAFAIWDDRGQRLIAGTDRFGVRPLYYAMRGDSVRLSNSAPLLYAHPDTDRSPNDAAVLDFLVHGELREGETAFTGISVLPAAHTLSWEPGRLHLWRYWSPTYGKQDVVSDDAPATFLHLLQASVADRVRGRPVSVFMSGGLDSTMVAATAVEGSGNPAAVRAFTVAYRELFAHDELPLARAAAAFHRVPLSVHYADDYRPFGEAMQLGMRHPVPVNEPFPGIEGDMFRAASRHGALVLTGHGSDAILADEPLLPALRRRSLPGISIMGTAKELLLYLARYRRHPPLGLRAPAASGPVVSFPPWLRKDVVEHVRPLRENEDKASSTARTHSQRMMAQLARAGLPASYTAYAAEFGMSCAHPLLDARLVEFCLSLPPIPWCWDKHLMRAAMRGRLPEAVRLRRKTPVAANRLIASSERHGFDWLRARAPGDRIRRFYAWDSFVPLAGLIRADDQWQHSRPVALEYFFEWWTAQPVVR